MKKLEQMNKTDKVDGELARRLKQYDADVLAAAKARNAGKARAEEKARKAVFEKLREVFAISGYRNFYPIKFGSNTFFRQNVAFSAWGYAVWRERHEMCSRIDANYFRKTFSLKKSILYPVYIGLN